MIIEASKPQFGSIINLLLHFIWHLSALQLMLRQPPPLANLHLLPTSTSCQPPPLANLYLLPTSTSCQSPALANLYLLPTSTSSQYPSFLNPRALTRALTREGAASLFYITLKDFPYFQTPFILVSPVP